MSSHTRKRKLQAHVIGALIAFTIAVTTIVPLIIINIQVINRGYNALDIARTYHEERMLEALKIHYNPNTGDLNITNIGGIAVKIVRIWIVDKARRLHIHDAESILGYDNVEITPGETIQVTIAKQLVLIGIETMRTNIFYYAP